MKKFLFVLVFALFVNVSFVNAEACDNNDISRLKVLANDVDITYVYNDDIYDSDGFKIYDTYKVTIYNMTDELYIKETKTNFDLSNYPVQDGTLVIDRMFSGKKTFKVYSKNCERVLKTYYVDLPKFNYYSTDSNCEGKEDLKICQKFYDTSNMTYDEFFYKVTSSENNVDEKDKDDEDNQIIQFLKNNYIYIGIGVVALAVLVVILILIHRKRSVLE